MSILMKCPICGTALRPNKGWAATFYDGYCNTCDMPIVDGIPMDENQDRADEYRDIPQNADDQETQI